MSLGAAEGVGASQRVRARLHAIEGRVPVRRARAREPIGRLVPDEERLTGGLSGAPAMRRRRREKAVEPFVIFRLGATLVVRPDGGKGVGPHAPGGVW